MLAIPSNPVFPVPKLLAPLKEVAACARGLDTQVFELCGRKREEGFPGRDFGGVCGEASADGCEEGGGVWDERCGLWNWADRDAVVERADERVWEGTGCRRSGVGCGLEEGAADDHVDAGRIRDIYKLN